MQQRAKVIRRALTRFVRGQSAPIPLTALLASWRRGFGGWSYIYYELAERGRIDDYLPDITMRDMAALNAGSGKLLLNNKLVFERVVGAFAKVPKVLAFIGKGAVVPLAEPPLRAAADLLGYCDDVGPLILKPIDGGKGVGILRLAAGPGGADLNGEPVTTRALADHLAELDGYLVTEFAQQAPYAQRIFPGASNTLRVVTMIDPRSGIPFIPAAIHRFGMARSAPTDNFSRGGLMTRIDLGTGRLGPGMLDGQGKVRWTPVHPETGAQLEGLVVERWPEIKATVLRVAAAVPFAPYVGWDLLIGEEGPVVIEGNADPSLHVQAHYPYLLDERVRAFVEHHGVLRRRGVRPRRGAPAVGPGGASD